MREHSFYPRLAITNIKSNGKFYYPYILTCIFTVAMFYIMMFIKSNEGISEMPGSDALLSFLSFGSIIIGIFATIFLFYTNSFLMKRRKKELGLYNILGMEKRHIAGILFWETVITGVGTVFLGIGAGILLSKLVFMLLLKLLKFSVPFGFSVSTQGISAAMCLFAVIFVLILLSNLLQIKLSKPIELLRGGEMGQKEPKTKIILTIFGLLSLGVAYAIALLTQSPLQAVFLFFIAVVLVILGTYALFTAGSIAVLKLMRNNKKYYYQTKHFTTVSGMLYRMKQNAVGLSNICILSTMVLVTISTTVALYIGFEDIINNRYPSDVSAIIDEPVKGEVRAAAEDILGIIDEHGLEPIDFNYYTYLSFAVGVEGARFTEKTDNFTGTRGAVELIFITAEEYERITGSTVSLEPNEVLVYSEKEPVGDSFDLFGTVFTVKEHVESFGLDSGYTAWLVNIHWIVVKDDTVMNKISALQAEAFGDRKSIMQGYISFDLSGSNDKIIACYSDMREAVRSAQFTYIDESGQTQTGAYDVAYFDCKQAVSDEIYNMYGSFLFLGIFLGTLFLVATILIIYYKQITEGYSDRDRFAIMQKVGMSRSEVKKTIKSQVVMVFFLPLAAACVHIVFAFSIITKLLALFNLTNVPLFAWCTIGTIAVFAIVYAIVYAVTARTYYKIVS